MIRLRKYCFKIFILSIIALSVISCSNKHSAHVEAITSSILALKGTDYSKLPDAILKYNNISDSIESVDRSDIKYIDSQVLKNIGAENDTLALAARMILYNPTIFGEWICNLIVEEVQKTPELSVTERNKKVSSTIDIALFLYKKSGEPSSIKEMSQSIDRCFKNLDIEKRSIFLTLISEPSALANRLFFEECGNSMDDQAAIQIDAIRKVYSKDPISLKKFNEEMERLRKRYCDTIN